MKPPQGAYFQCLGINGQHAHLDGCDGSEDSVCYDYRRSSYARSATQEINRNNNPNRTAEYFGALDWAHTEYPGRRVGPWVHPLWEAAHPGKKWDDLRAPESRVIEIKETNVFDGLRIPRPGKSNGPGTRERKQVKDPEAAMLTRELAVTKILEEKWPAPEFEVTKTGVGSDRAIKKDGQTVALVDIKSGLHMSSRQYKTAIASHKKNIPYWLVGLNWKYQVTPTSRRVPTQYRIIPEAQ
jgi:hypothetical protein